MGVVLSIKVEGYVFSLLLATCDIGKSHGSPEKKLFHLSEQKIAELFEPGNAKLNAIKNRTKQNIKNFTSYI